MTRGVSTAMGMSGTWARRRLSPGLLAFVVPLLLCGMPAASARALAPAGAGAQAAGTTAAKAPSSPLFGPEHDSSNEGAATAEQRAKALLRQKGSASKTNSATPHIEKMPSKKLQSGEALTVAELQSCYGINSPDVVAQRESRDRVLTMTVDHFAGPVPPAGDGNVSYAVTRAYDGQGRLVRREQTTVENGESQTQVVTCGYDNQGNLVTRTDDYEGSYHEAFTAVIGKWGLTEAERYTYRSDQGVVVGLATITYAYDSKGHRLSRNAVYDFGADGVADLVYNESATYDIAGNRTRVVSDTDWDGDGAVEERVTTFATYDGQGRWKSRGTETDYFADGVVDSRTVVTQTYNAKGDPVQYVIEFDDDGDGSFDSRSVVDSTYDSKGQLVTETGRSYDEPPFDTPDGTGVTQSTYDQKGRLVGRVATSGDSTLTEVFVRDQQGVAVDTLVTFDGPDFGTSYTRTTKTLDTRGNVVQIVEIDYDEGGLATADGKRLRFTYDLPGNKK